VPTRSAGSGKDPNVKRGSRRPDRKSPWEEACGRIEEILEGPARGEILHEALGTGDLIEALRRLRLGLRSHVFRTRGGRLALDRIVGELDRKTQEEGFHVLLEWDHASHRFIPESIAVLMLDFYARNVPAGGHSRAALAILLDYYFLYLLALLVIRAWDGEDVGAKLDRVERMLGHLQGPQGSGRRFVDDAGTLLLIAISGYEPDDLAYSRFLEKVWAQDHRQRVRVARVGAPLLGAHLRWGFPALYDRDLTRMRDDNFVDYPWLFFSVATLMDEYARMTEAGEGGADRDRISEALLNGLTPDPWAFAGQAPAYPADHGARYAAFREVFDRYRGELLLEWASYRPRKDTYTPIAFRCNFPHNALIAMVVLGLLGDPAPNLPVDALFTGGEEPRGPKRALAIALTRYAASNPERRGKRRVMMIAYDPLVGLRSHSRALAALRDELTRSVG